MQQIKIFKGLEHDVHALEKDVNRWLTENNVSVINIFGNIAPQSSGRETHSERAAPSDVLLVVVYEKGT